MLNVRNNARDYAWNLTRALTAALAFSTVMCAQTPVKSWSPKLAVKSPSASDVQAAKAIQNRSGGGSQGLPLWTFDVESSRDGSHYTGVIVGRNPYTDPATARIKTFIVPLVIKTASVTVGVDPNSGAVITQSGTTVFDPRAHDSCLTAPNDIALSLVQTSPVFDDALFNFGGEEVGRTQFADAFERADYWRVIGPFREDYHVLLNPVVTTQPITIQVPAASGTAVPSAIAQSSCATLGVVDLNWLDSYLTSVVLPSLKQITPATFPIFLVHDVAQSIGPPNLFSCCAPGYHSSTGSPLQTYATIDFDTTGLFPEGLQDSGELAQEIVGWINDPFFTNTAPGWTRGADPTDCENTFEVGTPLDGLNAPPIVMRNGFTYHLPELAFFSWFFGKPSTAIHHWSSSNGSLLTDAGPACQVTDAGMTAGGWRLRQVPSQLQ